MSGDTSIYVYRFIILYLDELLTDTKDKDCSNLVRMLVAAIASCNHAPEAQTSLVSEVRSPPAGV